MTKTHCLVDGVGRPLVIALTPGQAGDSPALPALLAELSVPRVGPGRPRTRPEALRGDKAYSSRGHRAHLRSRGIVAVIPEPGDQIANRKRPGADGGRPRTWTPRTTRVATSSNEPSTSSRTGAVWPRGTTSTPWSFGAASSSPRSCSGSDDYGDTALADLVRFSVPATECALVTSAPRRSPTTGDGDELTQPTASIGECSRVEERVTPITVRVCVARCWLRTRARGRAPARARLQASPMRGT